MYAFVICGKSLLPKVNPVAQVLACAYQTAPPAYRGMQGSDPSRVGATSTCSAEAEWGEARFTRAAGGVKDGVGNRGVVCAWGVGCALSSPPCPCCGWSCG